MEARIVAFTEVHDEMLRVKDRGWQALSFFVSMKQGLLKKFSFDVHPDEKSLLGSQSDSIALSLLPTSLSDKFRPLRCYGDGNCLFRCISQAIFGDEHHHVELRIRATMELVLHEDFYLNENKIKAVSSNEAAAKTNLLHYLLSTSVNDPSFTNYRTAFQGHVLDTAKTGVSASLYHIYALANVLKKPIQSVYPEMPNVGVDRNVHNQTVNPRGADQSCIAPIYVMWSHLTAKASVHGHWHPNHFVFLQPMRGFKRVLDSDVHVASGSSEKPLLSESENLSKRSKPETSLRRPEQGKISNYFNVLGKGCASGVGNVSSGSETSCHNKTDRIPAHPCSTKDSSKTESADSNLVDEPNRDCSKSTQSELPTDDSDPLNKGNKKQRVGDTPHQPMNFRFPKREYGLKTVVKRSFQPQWFKQWSWLHYLENTDSVLCHTCARAYVEFGHASSSVDDAFISVGYQNWKDATVKFNKHAESKCHKDATERILKLPKCTKDIGESLSLAHSQEKCTNRKNFLKILSNVRFLARQGLPLRGDGDERDSNFIQLYHLRGEDNPTLIDWLHSKGIKYTSAEIQNEMLKIMALKILRDIALQLRNTPFYSIMADETTDISNKEQVTICIRWVDDEFECHEDFIGMYKADNTAASTLVAIIHDVLLTMNLAIERARGQCYDGASSMAGSKNGVAVTIKQLEKRCLYTHCYGHALNLACSDTIKKCKVLKDALEVTREISILVKKSPKRDTHFQKLREELSADSTNIRLLCPTRWTVRANALKSILDNYQTLDELWNWSLDNVSDTDMKARIRGVKSYAGKFDFLYGVMLGELILRHADNLSRTLQSSKISAAQGQSVALMSVKTLEKIRTDESFVTFWEQVNAKATMLSDLVEEAKLPRAKRRPARYEVGKAAAEHPITVEGHYRQIYFEGLDLVINCIKTRFDQPDYNMYKNLQELLFAGIMGKDTTSLIETVTSFYGSDLNRDQLKIQLDILATNYNYKGGELGINDVMVYMKSLSRPQRLLLSEVCTLFSLILVMPATNAISERSFSALRRVKTYLRSTMSQQRLNHVMLLTVHKEKLDQIDLIDIANDFVSGHEGRLARFGKFTIEDTKQC